MMQCVVEESCGLCCAHSVQYAYKLVSARCALEKTSFYSQARATAGDTQCTGPRHPFPLLMWGMFSLPAQFSCFQFLFFAAWQLKLMLLLDSTGYASGMRANRLSMWARCHGYYLLLAQ
eukprot:scaffold101289_cov19-Tisochrysis_lutea.AAC.2